MKDKNKIIKKFIGKAKKEILEAEITIDDAHEKVVDVAGKLKGDKKKKIFTKAARNLEKAVYSAGESCEATEEAEEEIRRIK